jgi:hypothetical protein
MAKKPTETDPAEETAPPIMAGQPGEIVKVRGPEDGRWRGGLQFGPIEREVDLSTLTPEDFAAIEADPYLSVIGPLKDGPSLDGPKRA